MKVVTLDAFEQHSFLAFAEPIDLGDSPFGTFVRASLGQAVFPDEMRSNLGMRRVIVVAERDGRLQQPAFDHLPRCGAADRGGWRTPTTSVSSVGSVATTFQSPAGPLATVQFSETALANGTSPRSHVAAAPRSTRRGAPARNAVNRGTVSGAVRFAPPSSLIVSTSPTICRSS